MISFNLCCYLVTKSCLTFLWPPWAIAPSGSSIHRISQARTQKWVAISFFRGSTWPSGWNHVSSIGRWILYYWATRETPLTLIPSLNTLSKCIHILRYWELIGGLIGRHNSVHNREGGKRQEKEANMRIPKDPCLKINSPQSFAGGCGELRRESVMETAQ